MVAELVCPRCNCNDCESRGMATRWGLPVEAWECNFCGHQFAKQVEMAPQDKTIWYHVLLCPECRSDQVKTTSTRGTTRHHKCKACECTFKSAEKRS